MENKLYVVLDIGGTYVRISSTDSLSQPKFEDIKVIELTHSFEEDFNLIIEKIKEIAKRKINAIGISLPGRLDDEKNKLISAENIPEWAGIDFKEILKKKFNCKVYLENDAVTSALAEALYDGNHQNDFIFMIWGTGIGGAVVEMKPELKVKKLLKDDYLDEIRKQYRGRGLLEKYGKPLDELEPKDWDEIISNFSQLVIFISDRFKIKEFIIGGGVALKQKEKMMLFSENLKQKYQIGLRITNFGDHHTFGLYGASALIQTLE